MPENILLIDSGNTGVKWIRAVDGRLDTASFGRGGLEAFTRDNQRSDATEPDRILLSSVSGSDLQQALLAACIDLWSSPVTRLLSQASQAGISNAYENPEALGVDRWLAILAGARLHGLPLVVMDLGTATTLDAVDENGQHLGGMIFPGPATMLESLAQAAGLPMAIDELETFASRTGDGPGVGPGTSTESCLVKGVQAAQIGALDQFLRNVATKMNGEPALVATGGGAKVILSGLDVNICIDPWLVFNGMLISQE